MTSTLPVAPPTNRPNSSTVAKTGDQPRGIRSRAGVYGLVGNMSFSERGGSSISAGRGVAFAAGDGMVTHLSREMSRRSRWRPSACVTVATIVVRSESAPADRLDATTVASWIPVATRAVRYVRSESPSSSRLYSSRTPLRSDVKNNRWIPGGAFTSHSGTPSSARSSVKSRTTRPSAESRTRSSDVKRLNRIAASHAPSGDQRAGPH